MERLRSALFDIVFWSGTVAIVLAAPVAGLFGPAALRRHVHGWLAYHRWCAATIVGMVTRIEGAVPEAPALYAAKHQSMYETFELARLLDEPALIMKRELGRIPLWGWAARRYGMIVVDRAASSGALRQMMRDAKTVAAEGRSVMIFPEGTRVPPGATPPLKSGLTGLYKALALPVVPVALDSGRVWPRRGHKRAGIVTMRFAAPIPPGLSRDALEAAVFNGINALERPAETQ